MGYVIYPQNPGYFTTLKMDFRNFEDKKCTLPT